MYKSKQCQNLFGLWFANVGVLAIFVDHTKLKVQTWSKLDSEVITLIFIELS